MGSKIVFVYLVVYIATLSALMVAAELCPNLGKCFPTNYANALVELWLGEGIGLMPMGFLALILNRRTRM